MTTGSRVRAERPDLIETQIIFNSYFSLNFKTTNKKSRNCGVFVLGGQLARFHCVASASASAD